MSMQQVMQQIIVANPKFKKENSSLRGVLAAASGGGANQTELLQKELDLLSSDKASNYRDALQILLNDNPKNYYASVYVFEAKGLPSTVPPRYDLPSRRIRYTSAKMSATAELYCISPASMQYELGWIQHCTAKSDESEYTGGESMRDHTPFAFPIGDSASAQDEPFYYRGQSIHCTHPSWLNMAGKPAQPANLEVNDSFDDNFHYYHPRSTSSLAYQASTLQTITRRQSFTLWLAHKQPTVTRLLREVKFTIDVAVTVQTRNGAVSVSSRSTVDNISKRTPTAQEALPMVSRGVMNDQSVWQYRASSTSAWRMVL